MRADVDVSEFSETTLRFIRAAGEVYASPTFGEALRRLVAVSGQFTEQEVAEVLHDIVDIRNERVMAEFDKRIGAFDVVFIPWGAQHMPGLADALFERGFRVHSQRMIKVARYSTIFGGLFGRPARDFSAKTVARPRGVEPLLQD